MEFSSGKLKLLVCHVILFTHFIPALKQPHIAKPDVRCFEMSRAFEIREESKTLLIVKPVATVNLFEYSCMCFKLFKLKVSMSSILS